MEDVTLKLTPEEARQLGVSGGIASSIRKKALEALWETEPALLASWSTMGLGPALAHGALHASQYKRPVSVLTLPGTETYGIAESIHAKPLNLVGGWTEYVVLSPPYN